MTTTLVFSAVAAVAAGLIYAYVGKRLSERKVEGDARVAHIAFLVWWFALAANQLLTATRQGLYVAGGLPVWLEQLFAQISLLIVFVALWGLLYYLVFLYTGSSKSLVPIAVFYAVFYLALVVLTLAAPTAHSLGDDGWSVITLDAAGNEIEAFTGVVLIALLVFLLGPQIGASIAFLRLYTKVDDATQKFRILLVSLAILVWFGTPLVAVAFGPETSQTDGYNIFQRILAIVAALTILTAYLPPRPLREKFGLRSIAEES